MSKTDTPQSGVVSPLLANIYLHELDEMMEAKVAINRGGKRAPSVEGRRIMNRLARLRKQVDQLRADTRAVREPAGAVIRPG